MPLPPKDPARRRRTNKVAGARTLHVLPSGSQPKAPALPKRTPAWSKRTRDWWADIWASPMAPEFDSSDRHGLLILAELVEQFWEAPHPALAGEIRLQRQCFGLTPIDRRRLQWEIDRGEEADERRQTRTSRSTATRAKDPRAKLA